MIDLSSNSERMQAAQLQMASDEAQRLSRAQAKAAKDIDPNFNKAEVPGGCYLVNGKYVNAFGEPVGSPLPTAEEQMVFDPLNVREQERQARARLS